MSSAEGENVSDPATHTAWNPCPLSGDQQENLNDRIEGALLPLASDGERPLSGVQKLLLSDRNVVVTGRSAFGAPLQQPAVGY